MQQNEVINERLSFTLLLLHSIPSLFFQRENGGKVSIPYAHGPEHFLLPATAPELLL